MFLGNFSHSSSISYNRRKIRSNGISIGQYLSPVGDFHLAHKIGWYQLRKNGSKNESTLISYYYFVCVKRLLKGRKERFVATEIDAIEQGSQFGTVREGRLVIALEVFGKLLYARNVAQKN